MREHFSVRRWGLHPRPPALESDLVHNFVNDLKGFPNLRNVTLTQQTLWEPWFNACPGFENERSFCDEMRLINMLPPSIESFALYDVTPDFLPCLFELALHVASGLGFQNLKEVTLRPSPNFIRQLKHARCHQDDPHLQFFDEHDRSCRLDQTLLPRWGAIGMMFKSSGVRVDAALEVHPLDTEDPEPLQRQRELQHWCDKCHFDSSVCVHREPGLFDVYAN
ncbi:hypothetical protein GL218_08327 [Daldinia childiae]|uniref:uncharacterized protein n=1 Tax=Daldinia childiae TaxID=326645 RepID=UPI0014488BFD|nr:uncharacterized protein GL218_08327 [Daldinia childiae]KAF3068294.1 hypothetical protein GL218_08327 [Daldinia childiae]